MKTIMKMLIIVAIGFVLSGCATTKQAGEIHYEISGFLDNYHILRRGGSEEALRVYKNPQANWPVYEKVLLDPVEIWLRHEAQKEISHVDLQQMANNFYSSISTNLSRDFRMVTVPEPLTLRIQVAITDIEESSAKLDRITTILPVGQVVSKGKELATGKPAFVGETSIEFKVVDAASGTLLAAGMDRRVGSKTIKEVDSWADANNAFEDWGNVISSRLCRLQGRANCAK